LERRKCPCQEDLTQRRKGRKEMRKVGISTEIDVSRDSDGLPWDAAVWAEVASAGIVAAPANEHNARYLATKRERMGHRSSDANGGMEPADPPAE
jgi:hypothetical protein